MKYIGHTEQYLAQNYQLSIFINLTTVFIDNKRWPSSNYSLEPWGRFLACKHRHHLVHKRHDRLHISESHFGARVHQSFAAILWIRTADRILSEVIIFSFGTVKKSAGDFYGIQQISKGHQNKSTYWIHWLKILSDQGCHIKLKSFLVAMCP